MCRRDNERSKLDQFFSVIAILAHAHPHTDSGFEAFENLCPFASQFRSEHMAGPDKEENDS
jgi:hypothetical protein